MTNPDPEALIAEARGFGGSWSDAGDLFQRLADALEERQARLISCKVELIEAVDELYERDKRLNMIDSDCMRLCRHIATIEELCYKWENGPASSEDEAHGVMMCARELRDVIKGGAK